MKRYTLVLSLFFQLFFTKAQSQVSFQKTYGSSFSNAFIGTNDISIVETFDGNYCIGGAINENNGDAYLMKLSTNGDTIWTKTFGGNFDDVVFSIAQTPDSGFVLAGQTRSFSMGNQDAFLIKTNSKGDLSWSKNYGGFDYDWFSSIYPTSDNGFIACGTTSTYGAGIQDVYLVKLDSSGNIQWTKTYGGGGWDRGSSVRPTIDNGYIITGSTTSFTASSGRIYLIKTDSNGDVVWAQIFGGVMGEGGHCVRQCPDSGFIVTGYTNSFGAGAQDVFLLKTDWAGTVKWMKTYGGSWEDIGYHMEVTSDGGFIVVGRTESFGPGAGSTRNVYLFKTNSVGDTLWTKAFGSAINNGYCVIETKDKGFALATNTDNFTVIKTDSLGHKGCDEYGTNTIVNAVTPVLLSGADQGSGGTSDTASTFTRYSSIMINNVCGGTDISEVLSNDLPVNVYPNPFSDQITLATLALGELQVVIFDIAARRILRKDFSNLITLDLGFLEDGIYLYEIKNENGEMKKGWLLKQ